MCDKLLIKKHKDNCEHSWIYSGDFINAYGVKKYRRRCRLCDKKEVIIFDNFICVGTWMDADE